MGQLALVGEDEIDLLDVLGAKPVLVLALCVFAIGVDEEDLVLECVGLALVADQHAGGDARAVEEAGRQADDGLYAVVVDEELADELFLATTEQDPVRHDRRHPAVGLEAGEHVLHEHEVRLLAGLRAPLAEAAGELHAGAVVVLRKRRVGEHPVKLADLAVVEDERVLERVTVLDGGPGDVVEDHVHDADRPDRAVGVLSVEGEVVGVLALLFHVLVGLNEEPAGADRRVVDGVAGLRLGELDEQADDLARGIELTALLAGAVGEELDEVLIGGAEQVGELEIVVDEDEPGLAEVVEQVFPLLVRDLGLALHRVEVDVVLQHPGERIVLVLDGCDGLVEHVADVVLEVFQGRHEIAVLVLPGLVPAGSDGDKESLAVGCLVLKQFSHECLTWPWRCDEGLSYGAGRVCGRTRRRAASGTACRR